MIYTIQLQEERGGGAPQNNSMPIISLIRYMNKKYILKHSKIKQRNIIGDNRLRVSNRVLLLYDVIGYFPMIGFKCLGVSTYAYRCLGVGTIAVVMSLPSTLMCLCVCVCVFFCVCVCVCLCECVLENDPLTLTVW